MNLLNPLNLLWLLPLGGGIIALWMLRLKRRDVTVSSLFLWQSLLKETQANTPFQKLRRNLALFLQLLTAFLLLLAFARPFVYGRGQAARTLILIIDHSASMNATDTAPTRLAVAKAAALQTLRDEMRPGDVATVIAASNKAEAIVSFTSDRNRLESAINGIAPTDTVAEMPAALTLAQSLIGSRAGTQVRVFTDGAFRADDAKKLAAIPLPGADVKELLVGANSADNVGITACDGRRNPATGQYEVFVHIENFGGRVHPGATLSLLRDGKLIDARALLLPAGNQSETFDSPLLKDGGLITVRLDDLKDDLATDNQASLVLPPPRKRKILLVSAGNLFLEQGLNVDPDVVLEEVAPEEFATVGKGGAEYALVVFDGVLPKTPLPPGNYLTVNVTGGQTPVIAAGAITDGPQFIDQSRTHPAMRFVDLDGLKLRRAPQVTTTNWGQSLAEADSGTLIAAGEHDGLRMVSVAFDLSDSDWPLRVSFPIFLTNAVNWLTAGSGLGASAPDTPTGAVASLAVPPGPPSINITRPDGTTTPIAAPPTGGLVVYDGTQRAGIYHARTGTNDYPFAVNLLSADESNLTPQMQPALSRKAPAAVASAPIPLSKHSRNDLVPLIAALALLFLAIEWLVFHRRV